LLNDPASAGPAQPAGYRTGLAVRTAAQGISRELGARQVIGLVLVAVRLMQLTTRWS